MTNTFLIIVFALSAIITFSLRAVPFVLFGRKKDAPKLIKKLGDLLPYAVIASLVVYCLKDITTLDLVNNIKLISATAVVIIMHLWKKNTILSIAVGTTIYIILLHI